MRDSLGRRERRDEGGGGGGRPAAISLMLLQQMQIRADLLTALLIFACSIIVAVDHALERTTARLLPGIIYRFLFLFPLAGIATLVSLSLRCIAPGLAMRNGKAKRKNRKQTKRREESGAALLALGYKFVAVSVA